MVGYILGVPVRDGCAWPTSALFAPRGTRGKKILTFPITDSRAAKLVQLGKIGASMGRQAQIKPTHGSTSVQIMTAPKLSIHMSAQSFELHSKGIYEQVISLSISACQVGRRYTVRK
jgi:hypothetical protein